MSIDKSTTVLYKIEKYTDLTT